eukprot:867136_1
MQVLHIACVILVLQMIETIQFQEEDDRNRMETLVRRQTSQLPGTSIVSLHIDDIIWMNGERAIESNEAITTNAMDALIISSSLKCIQQLSVTFVNTLPFAVFDDFDPIQSSSNPCIVTRYSSTFPSTSNQVHSPFCVLRSNVHAQKLTIKDEQTISKIDNPSAYQYSSPIHVYDCDDTQQSMNSQPVTHSPTFRVTQKHFLLFRPWTPTFSNLILLSILVLALLNACSTKRHVSLYKIAILFLFIITPINGQTSFPFSSLPSNAPTPFPSSYPTIAPTECLEEVKQELDVSTLSNWRQDADPETVGSGTFILGTSADYCYVRKPCIRMKGRTTSGKGDFWVERTLDVSRWRDITIHVKLYTRGLDNDNEYAFIDTQCDTASEAQRTETNHNFNGPYSECFFVDVSSCTALTVGIGGHLSGTGDYVYVTYLAIDYTETPDPTLYPTTQPSNAPSSSPTPAPSFSPSAAPTSAPSEAPTPSTPTTAPTFTDKSVYVSKTGCDYGICNYSNSDYTNLCVNNVPTLGESASYCCHDPSASPSVSPVTAQPTCSSIEYGWNCFLGIGGYPENSVCQDQGYDANGVFNLGAGTWDFPYQIDFDDNNVIIRGSDALSTVLNYIGDESVWVTCAWKKCWIGLQDLTLSSSRNSMIDVQFQLTNGGTLSVKNVVFDGTNYAQNGNGAAFWQFIGSQVTVVFDSCQFYNHDVMYSFLDGVNAEFIDCMFLNNKLTTDNGLTATDAMFHVDNANLMFDGCAFVDNRMNERALLYATNTANITIIRTSFINNTAVNANLFQFVSYDGDLIIRQSLFRGNQGYQTMISVEDTDSLWHNDAFECVSSGADSLNKMEIISTSFMNNTNIDYLFYINGKTTYFDASTFADNECSTYCIVSEDASLEMNGDAMTDASNFMRFMHSTDDPTNNITLCLANNTISTLDIAQHISFGDLNPNNAKLIVDDCGPLYTPNHIVMFDETDTTSVENHVYDTPGIKVDKQLNCIQSNARLCQIFCNATVACFASSIVIDEVASNLKIHCESPYSCQNSIIHSSGIAKEDNTSLHIICDADSSCQETQITLTNMDHLKMDCITPESCIDSVINISSTVTAEINCYELNACDNLQIHTDSPNTTLTLHEYSSNVLISNPVGYNQNNLNCGSEDAYFTLTMHETTLQSITNTLYPQLPCSDVIFICNDTEIENPSKYCDIETLFIDDVLTQDYYNLFDFYSCYGPIQFEDVTQLQCLGTCPQSPTSDPTAAPSFSPTLPSMSPTTSPSYSPSFSPTESPSNAPTIAPSHSPTQPPTLPPTPQCPTIFVSIVESPNAFNNDAVFNGLYTYRGAFNGFPMWATNPLDGKTVMYVENTWIISGFPSVEQLSFPANTIHPPMDDNTSIWFHSNISGTFRVNIHCIESYSPTNAPTNSPTVPPTSSPTTPPTTSPTGTPTISPTFSPSNAPSSSPSFAPTYNPISSNDFQFFIQITFILTGVDDNFKMRIGKNAMNESDQILRVLKDEYVADDPIAHEDLLLEMISIEGVEIAEIIPRTTIDWTNKKKLEFLVNTECTEFACASIKEQSRPTNNFDDDVSGQLRALYSNDQLVLSTKSADSLEVIDKNAAEEEEPTNWVLYGISVICGFLMIVGFGALLFNKTGCPRLPGFEIVDDAKWTSVWIFALQFWDFYSDINLSVEIWNTDKDFLASEKKLLLLISAFGSTFFVLIPYIANLVVAARIKHVVRKNPMAKGYFQGNTPLFALLVVVTGGAYPALALVSSRIFGLQIMSCGLTQYELKQMSKIKVLGTVLLENVPQLVCQGLYAYAIGNTTQAVQLAFIASLLSVTASSLSYLIDRDTDDTEVVQYDLSFQCRKARDRLIAFPQMDKENHEIGTPGIGHGDTLRGGEDDDEERAAREPLQRDRVPSVPSLPNRKGHVSVACETPLEDDATDNKKKTSTMNAKEARSIKDNIGCTKALGQHLAQCFEIPDKNIEVGQSMVTKYGLTTHVVHYVYTDDLDRMATLRAEEFQGQNQSIPIITPVYFTQQMCISEQNEIEKCFRNHFELNDDFRIQYRYRVGGTRTRSNKHESASHIADATIGNESEPELGDSDPRIALLERVATRIELSEGLKRQASTTEFNECQLKQQLKKFFDRKGVNDRSARLDLLGNFIQHEIEEQGNLHVEEIRGNPTHPTHTNSDAVLDLD